MLPSNFVKITENLVFQNGKKEGMIKNKYKLIIVKRFKFSSKFQTNSVIVKNSLDNSYRYFIKGAPEKIAKKCYENSIPENFLETLSSHTKIGFCIIACATKPLLNYNEEIQYEREFFEKDLYFLGFIILRNNIKVDSKILVKKIKSTNSNLIMATGDNPFTSLSVAMDINLVELTDDIYLCNLEDNKIEKKKSLNLYNINMNENNNINIGNERRNSFKNNTLFKSKIILN